MLVPKLRFKREDGTSYSEWEEKKIGDILTLCHGKDYKHLENGDIPVMGTGGVITYVNKALCDWECVCIGRKGTIDKPYYMNKPFWSVDTLFYSKPLGNNMPKFQYYLFQNINWYFYNEASGVPSLSASTIENIKSKVPCLEEQQKIADFLSTVDEIIVQSEAEVQNLEQQKKAAMQKIFSQEVRFKREDGTDYPDWEDCILSDHCEELKSSIDPKKYPQDSFFEYSMPAFDMNKKPSNVIGNDMNSNRKVINCPCVLINKLNVRKKRVWKIINPTNNSVCSAEFIPVTSDKMSIDFLEHLALSDRFTARLLDCSTGTSNSQKRVTPDIIMDMPVLIPCLEEQQKIANFLSAYDEAITCAKQELEHWKQLKKGLLQQMFV